MNNIFSIYSLGLHNFKCYDDTDKQISFGKELTVIIGQNGTGKTALLNGIKKAVSIVLAKDRRKNYKFVGDGLNIKQNTIKLEDSRYNFEYSEIDEDYEFPVSLDCSGIIRDQEKEWHIEKPDKRSRSEMTFRDALDTFLAPFNAGENPYPKLPVLCFFSDCFPHVRNDMAKYEKDILFNKSDNPERRAGYYRWDEDSTDFYFWTGMYVNAYERINDVQSGFLATERQLANPDLSEKSRNVLEKRLESLNRSKAEIEYVGQYLKLFTRSIKRYDNENIEIEDLTVGKYDGKGNAIKITFTNGQSRFFDMLPEGHKRLFAIVFEIAYRHFVLNRVKVLENPNECKPEGIVIIDEVELHLHPSLAEETIARLRNTFPDVQFIVTTHSPTIVSNVYNDGKCVRVVRLNKNHDFSLAENCFQTEYSDTMVIAMGAYNSMRYIQTLRQRYLDAKEENNIERLQEIRQSLLEFVGNIANASNVVDDMLTDWNNMF